MNRWPAAAMISANSRSGRSIYFLRGPLFGFGAAARVSESSGLADALRCRSDRCRYRLVVFRSAWPSRS